MNKTRPVPINSALTGPPIPVQAKIAAAWTSFMFLDIYVDYLHLYTSPSAPATTPAAG